MVLIYWVSNELQTNSQSIGHARRESRVVREEPEPMQFLASGCLPTALRHTWRTKVG